MKVEEKGKSCGWSLGGHRPQSWWRKSLQGKESYEKDQAGVVNGNQHGKCFKRKHFRCFIRKAKAERGQEISELESSWIGGSQDHEQNSEF